MYYLLLLIALLSTQAQAFTIYAFIPWKTNDKHHQLIESQLQAHNIIPIKVLYENQIFTNGEIDKNKLKQIAQTTNPKTLISFDLENGHRFHPETVLPTVQNVLQTYKSIAPKAKLGVYAILPQTTYSYKPNINRYDPLNEKYKSLINYVDFLSPVLYNYDGLNLQAWKQSAAYNINAAKIYASGKPIIPFISPIVRLKKSDTVENGFVVQELDEKSMAARLQILYDLGASGCIIWASSQDRTSKGQFPEFNPNKDWGRAVVNFIK